MAAGFAGVVEGLVGLWHAVVVVAAEDAEQAFVELLADSPKQPDLRSGIVVEMCRIMMGIHFRIESGSSVLVWLSS